VLVASGRRGSSDGGRGSSDGGRGSSVDGGVSSQFGVGVCPQVGVTIGETQSVIAIVTENPMAKSFMMIDSPFILLLLLCLFEPDRIGRF
jgi:hypothetical protein